ncbi:MAG: ABC transporter ATP-binding protein [Pseudoxanthomonas suwonensis]|nr:ABC transporter ATP-binding protein [Pseudoxanthomonas suwonensis]
MTATGDARVPVIRTEGLGKVYAAGTEAEVVALRDADMVVHRGEFVAIVGASGSGKSTLMNLIGCLDSPTSGRYLCDGIDVATLDAEQRARLRLDKIGFVFQGFNLLPRMSALDNVAMPMAYANAPRHERHERAAKALSDVGLGERLHHRPNEMSGGQQQRVAIARALINRPPILLADEPTGALDSRTGEEILALFKRLQDEDHTIVLITHDPQVAESADRVFVMHDGLLREQQRGETPADALGHDGAHCR